MWPVFIVSVGVCSHSVSLSHHALSLSSNSHPDSILWLLGCLKSSVSISSIPAAFQNNINLTGPLFFLILYAFVKTYNCVTIKTGHVNIGQYFFNCIFLTTPSIFLHPVPFFSSFSPSSKVLGWESPGFGFRDVWQLLLKYTFPLLSVFRTSAKSFVHCVIFGGIQGVFALFVIVYFMYL